MAQPSRPQCRAARESPEERYYSGLHSVSEVPMACPSQLFRVWLCGRVWYQWNADSLRVALMPTLQTARSFSLPLYVLPSAVSPHAEWRSWPEGVSRAWVLSAFWQPWWCKYSTVTLATALLSSRSISNYRRREDSWSMLVSTLLTLWAFI